MKRQYLPFVLIILGLSIAWKPANAQDDEMNDFINELMAEMTIAEMIGQTVMYTGGWDVTGPIVNNDYVEFLKAGQLGAMLNVYTAEGTGQLQKVAVEESRLGIPLLFGYDVVHGHRTIFPINLGSAASWDLGQIERSARIAAEEASSEGLHWTFAPMVDICRDPRWGRISEGAGEDVYLGSQIAEAYIRGFQGENISAKNTILACSKHFAAYGAAQAGRDYHTTDMSERELRETFLPPFKATVDAGAWTFMTSFNDLNGVPATGNSFLFKKTLREDWGFDGFVVSDYTAINELIPHGFARDGKDAARLAFNAGVDMDMMGSLYRLHLKSLMNEELVDSLTIAHSCRLILEAKYRLGLFEDPYRYIDADYQEATIYKNEFLAAARELVAHSCVLLKNDDRALPLSTDQKIALIGPLAKDETSIIGNWAAAGDRTGKAVSIYEGMVEAIGEDQISFAQGCEIDSEDKSQFDMAIQAANEADVILMVMGEHYEMSGEAASRTNIGLPGVQTELIKAMREAHPNKPIILVLMNGRPLTLSMEHEIADAILEAWFPGTMGGAGVTDILFGNHNPSGKLPVTFPRVIGQIPIHYNVKNTGRPINPDNPKVDYRSFYLDAPNDPLYPFGYGLSYTTFEYSTPTLSSQTMPMDGGKLEVSVNVTNTGNYDGYEVVQLYIHDKVASITRPIRQLKKFQKILIPKGSTKTLTFTLSAEDLQFYGPEMKLIIEPGEIDVYVGGSSVTENMVSFEVVK